MIVDGYPSAQYQKAYLVEDFILTANEVHGAYARVLLSDSLKPQDLKTCPLARVPSPYFIYPLKKDAVVYVQAPPESPNALVIVETDFKLPAALTDNVALPTADNFSFPSDAATTAFHYYSENLAVITTDDYTIVQSGESIMLIAPELFIQYLPSSGEYAIKTGKYTAEFADICTIRADAGYDFESSGRFLFRSNNHSLKSLVDEIFSSLADLYTKMGAFDAHTHVVSIPATSPPGTPSAGTASPTTSPTAASPAALNTFKAQNVDPFFQET